MLLDALKRRASEEILFPLGEVGRRSVREVLGFASAWREAHEDWRGRAVSVGKMTSADLALFLFCLDGWASALRLELGDSDDPGLSLMRSEADGDVSQGDVTTQWWLPTSATTRREPRWIAHDLESLSRSLQRDGLQGAGLVWGLCYDLRRFAGLQVFLQSALSGAALAIVSENRDPLADFRDGGVTALSATPSQWRQFLRSDTLDDLALQIVTLGGEIVDERLLGELRRRFPKARLTHIYASTEFGVGFSVRDGCAGFPVSYVESGVSGLALKVGEEGDLWVRRFSNDPWLDTGDLVERVEDRYFFCGRRDGLINVGGVKVAPEKVERVLLEVPGVSMALVRGRRSSLMGEMVEALVVPDPSVLDHGLLEGAIFEQCRNSLVRPAVPAVVNVVEALPLTPVGKLRRFDENGIS